MKNRILSFVLSLLFIFTLLPINIFAYETKTNQQRVVVEPQWNEKDIQDIYNLLNKDNNEFESLFDFEAMKNLYKEHGKNSFQTLAKSANVNGGLEIENLRAANLRINNVQQNINPDILKIKHELIVKVNLKNFIDQDGHKNMNIFEGNSPKIVIQKLRYDESGKEVSEGTPITRTITQAGEVSLGETEAYYLVNNEIRLYHYAHDFQSEKFKFNLKEFYSNGSYKDGDKQLVFDYDIYQVAASKIKLELPDGVELKDNPIGRFTGRTKAGKEKVVRYYLPKAGGETIIRSDSGNQRLLNPSIYLPNLDDVYLNTIKLEGQTNENTITCVLKNGSSKTFKVSTSGNFVDGWTIKLLPEDSFTVTFDAKGGSPKPRPQVVQKNKTATEPEAPKKKNFIFQGWFKEGEDSKFEFSTPISGDTSLEARWKQVTYGPFNPDGPGEEPQIPDTDKDQYVTVMFEAGDNGKLIMPGASPEKLVKKVAYKVLKDTLWTETGITLPQTQGDPKEKYELDKWNKDIPSTGMVSEAETFKASFKEKVVPNPPTPPQPPTPPTPPPQPPIPPMPPQPPTPPIPHIPNRGGLIVRPYIGRRSDSVEMEEGIHYIYIRGYEDKTIRPEGRVSRAEAVTMILRLAGKDLSNKKKLDFVDTPSGWYNGALNKAVELNMLLADGKKLRPNAPMTRGEFAYALSILDTKNDAKSPYPDIRGHKFEDAINQEYGNGRIDGYLDGTFKPDDYLSRAEAAKLLNHYAKRKVSESGLRLVKDKVKVFPDIDASHWAYYEIVEAGHTHRYRRPLNSLDETWIEILE
ncbi:S-layer homology domain-containing protein [Peptoniphilus sp. GNH]|nr:S-layer homology domain-containing protein [Peptoniphilus sp. GNH]